METEGVGWAEGIIAARLVSALRETAVMRACVGALSAVANGWVQEAVGR
jgi:hypothetical protein